MASWLLSNTWPTLPTLVMFPVLVIMYVRLAHQEERDALAAFGEVYARYVATTPSFLPRLRRVEPRETWLEPTRDFKAKYHR